MAKHVLVGHDEYIGPWVTGQLGSVWHKGHSTSIGLVDIDEEGKGTILAGALYSTYNKANVFVHSAAVPGKRWLNREYLWYIFHYPFVQLKCRRVTVLIASSNTDSLRFVSHLGATLEATLKDAHPDGDLLVYKMTAEDCPWLTLKDRKNEIPQP